MTFNPQAQWNECNGYHKYLVLRSLGVGREVSWQFAERNWVSLSLWTKSSLKRLAASFKKKDDGFETFKNYAIGIVQKSENKDSKLNRAKERAKRFPKKESENA